MGLILVVGFCLVLMALGLALLLKSPTNIRSGPAGAAGHAGNTPRTYILRIAGVMLMTFGLALGLMVTLFHFA